MGRIKKLTLFFLLTVAVVHIVNGQAVNLYQKKGIWQDKPEKQIQFDRFERVEFDFKQIPLKRVCRMNYFENKLYVLDSQRNELYVMDKKGKYIRTIGRPGQGPGDIEHASDFTISSDKKIYILNRMSNRVEIFKIDGTPIKTIRMNKEASGFALNESVAVDSLSRIFLGSSMSDMVTMFNQNGEFIKTLLNRNNFFGYPQSPHSVGNPCQVMLLDKDIIIFEKYKGIFASLNLPEGKIRYVFGGYSQSGIDGVKEFDQGSKNKKNGLDIVSYWTNFYIDENQIIYAFEFVSSKKGDPQLFYAFSKYGNLLYIKQFDFFRVEKIKQFCCDKESFAFYTSEQSIIIAYRRK